MRLRKRYLPLAALLGAAVAVVPTLANSAVTATINAESNSTCGYYANCWSPAQVTVTSGDMVAFKNSSGVPHGVVWESGNPATPTCAGVPVNSSLTSFNGTCTFTQAGTYAFYCYVHGPSMSGRVTVNSNGTTTVTTTTGTTTTTTTTKTGPPPTTSTTTTTPPPTTTTTTPTQPPAATQSSPLPGVPTTPATTPAEPISGSPLAGGASALKVIAGRGVSPVRGSVDVSPAGAGGKLEVTLVASGASIARAHRPAQVRVGRLVRASVRAGVVSFAVPLSARARAALRRHRRLALTVRIVLTPVSGPPVTVAHSVVLRG